MPEAAPAVLDADRARLVTLLQAFETAEPASPNWSDDDRAWATRLALHDAPAGEGADAGAAEFIARRAAHAWQRLGPREPAAAAWLVRRLWRGRWIAIAVSAGLLLGIAADSVGSAQRINLLAPPLWAVLAWNAAVYAALLGHAVARLMRRRSAPGAVTRLMQRALQFARAVPRPTASPRSPRSPSGAALRLFATLWTRRSAALSAARAATLLHAAAAALALGLIGGLYLRGLVLDYRAAWESTFLGAGAAHAAVATLLAPAAALAGIALPDAAGFEALRIAHGAPAVAPAAAWIHLFALTLALFVLLPRSLLALAAAWHAQWLARRVVLPDDAYLQRLTRAQRRDIAQVVALPYASTPDAQAALGLRALLTPALGDALQLRLAPTVDFGCEDEAPLADALPPDTTLALVCFDLTATPEQENQGRFARRVALAAPDGVATLVLVDEAAFARRFGADSTRRTQRREAWRAFAQTLGTTPVFVELAGTGVVTGPDTLQVAMRQPVSRAAP